MDVTVCVATYGAPEWEELARDRAIPSAQSHRVPVVHVHGPTLHDARNWLLDLVHTEWVCYLDADDELEPRYFEHMAEGTADLRAPAVRYVSETITNWPRVPKVAGHTHDCTAECLAEGNWLVVGSVVRAQLVRDVGGWRDFVCYEDYDLWARCWKAGASIEAVPKAVYTAHVRKDSRNRAPSQAVKMETHRQIARANGLLVPA